MLIGLQPVLVHMSKNAAGKFSFHPVSINFLVEIVKTAFAITMLVIYILVIALLMRFILKRHFSIWQWEALVLLMAGITVNQLSNCGASNSLPSNLLAPAILYTAGSICIPSLASVYNEMALKKNMDTSVHVQNFFLYLFGLLFNLFGLFLLVVLGHQSISEVFKGHSKVTMLLVVNNAMQGILSSFFFKYADTILKKYSSTMATIFTGLMSAALFGHALTINFCIGVTIVFISMHIFFSHGSVAKAALKSNKGSGSTGVSLTTSPSLEHLQTRSESIDSLASLDSLHETDTLMPRRPATLPH